MAVQRGLEEAIAICCDHIQALDSEYLHINDAFMRVAAEDIASPINVPNFDRSSIDGYAISEGDLGKLRTGEPLTLKVIATIQAGSIESKQIRAGETHRIMTGALLPEGCAAVIKQEDVRISGNLIVACGSLKQGENIQRAGHELTAGERVAPKGLVLNAEILERIAACGIENILVHQIPRIYVINTGSELLLPGSPIKTGQIYNSNRSLLSAKVAGSGAIPVLADSIIKDDLQQIVNEIEKATPVSDMIIISGGTGNGVYDLVYNAFEYLNASPLFKGIDITPGKGTSAALFNGKLLYNLSGNPHAAGILFEVLIKPALLKLKGDLFSAREWFDIQLDSPIKKIKPYRRLCQGEMLIEQGSVYAQPVSGNNNPIKNISLILDIRAGQGAKGDMVRAIILN
ncbi:molybdopterin molybdotransferase MoeA [Syntrophaceticus schinkii]|uniref:Molybdopterin molybdenumtransferase n=1 Tax=Syntrophaceticus schinkii TaxID=499207 RepID=A0A0B7MAL6_9FIRM|nr:molybdopterin molybdotransferase MoeA [Syntrophaceticus schinkii]MDD2358848.1 molybdopterin molybdotransferase MoeA [Syntrophaceticus schinkii]MDD4260802.1 molybdopterin molybdotransferase MoeA [Syntrophaceticus schinkii]MDD4674119.1 molybdopterin molybdotransferase MoeA [Syntrophaceticus schinkii]CEO87559.1 putative molybdopterin biosynthesis MoeA protein [Syntrophaceticus schinkii]